MQEIEPCGSIFFENVLIILTLYDNFLFLWYNMDIYYEREGLFNENMRKMRIFGR